MDSAVAVVVRWVFDRSALCQNIKSVKMYLPLLTWVSTLSSFSALSLPVSFSVL